MLENLNIFAGVSGIVTTIITIFFFMVISSSLNNRQSDYEDDSETQTAPKSRVDINSFWFWILFIVELYPQLKIEHDFGFGDAIINIIFNVVLNGVIFIICYIALSIARVNIDDRHKRSNKAFMGLVIVLSILSFLLVPDVKIS